MFSAGKRLQPGLKLLAAGLVLLIGLVLSGLVGAPVAGAAPVSQSHQSDAEQWFTSSAEDTYYALLNKANSGAEFSVGAVHQLSEWAPDCLSGTNLETGPELAQMWAAVVSVAGVKMGVLTVSNPASSGQEAGLTDDPAVIQAASKWETGTQLIADYSSGSMTDANWYLVNNGQVQAVGDNSSQQLAGTVTQATYCQILAEKNTQKATPTVASEENTESGISGGFPLWIPIVAILLMCGGVLVFVIRHERRVIAPLHEKIVESDENDGPASGRVAGKDIS